jgi:FMN phosphatase YigB (HAD superfamily)
MATRIEAVVFDLFFTLVHPGTYPGGSGREDWMAGILGIDAEVVADRWASFWPTLEAGRAPIGPNGLEPELHWILEVAADAGVLVTATDLERIKDGWDLTRRAALVDPPAITLSTLRELRGRGVPIGISHEIGACKPSPAAYAAVLGQLGVPAAAAAYVGDGSNDELAGAKTAGFSVVILVEEATARSAPTDLPRLRAQADTSVTSLGEILGLIDR